MATWTKMKIDNLVQIEWADALKKFVRCKTLYGELLESVESLKNKVQDQQLLAPIRAIFSDMLAFAEGNKNENKEDAEPGRTGAGSPRVE